MNHSTRMDITARTLSVQSLIYKLKRTRVLFLWAAITIPTTSFAQKNVVENVAKRDSVCRKEQKALSDSTALHLYLRFQGFSPLILKRKEAGETFQPQSVKLAKIRPRQREIQQLATYKHSRRTLVKMKKVLFSVLSMLFFCLCTYGQAELKEKDSLLYTSVEVYSHKMQTVAALVDTGCSLCVVDSTFAKDSLGIAMPDKLKLMVNSRDNRMPTCVVDSVRFCGKTYRQVLCIIINLKGKFQRFAPDFILGADILKDRPLRFDYETRTISPYLGNNKGGIVLKWKDSHKFTDIPMNFIVFETRIQGQHVRLVFDTGSRNNKLPNDIRIAPSGTIQKETANVSQQLTIKQVRQYKGVTFGLGKQTIALDFIEGEDNYGLLSLNFLKGHSFILNYKEKKLEILAPSL